MKKLGFIFIAIFAFATQLVAQETDTTTFVTFEKTAHNFGQVTDAEDAVTVFKFTNNTNEAIVLNPPKASCGCTTPYYPKEPIASGETGEIKVKYSTKGRIGKFVKNVRVYAQGFEEPIKLTIKGEVVKEEDIATLPKKDGGSLFK